MKKDRIKASIILVVTCIILLSQSNSYAQNATSEAEIEFAAGTGPTYPVHPEDPSTVSNDDSVEGSLALVSISPFDFGTVSVTSMTGLYDIVTTMPNIQVVDLRGTAAGWKVSADVTRFTNGTTNTLPGASIKIESARPNSLSTSPPPTQAPNIVLTTDGTPVPVIEAESGAGTGLWVMRWYPSEAGSVYVKLEIPAGAASTGSHTATINWILEDTP